jgi:alkanesulfonate monooxygenase SsuD/methylene tetrahydromethanopterin reductase-like flavin-dependent oxidoreductase (luciferase family)
MQFYCFIQGAWYDRAKPPEQLYDEMIEEAMLAEELGYDGIWLAEQNLVTFLATPAPIQLASVIAQKTKRIRIGVAVFILPFHHPLRLAGEVAQLDVLIRGRFDCGVGRGASPYQLRQFQREMPEADSRRLFEEHLGIMVRHWTNTKEEQSHDGEFFKFPAATVLPEPYQKPHPPVWIAALSPGSTEWAVKLGFNSNHLFSPFREPFPWVETVYGAFEKALKEVGRDRAAVKFAVNRMTYVAETAEKAREVLPWVQRGHRVVQQQITNKEEVRHGEYQTDKPVANEPSLDEMFANTLMGDPDMVRAKLRPYYELGVDVLSSWHHLGEPHDDVMHSMELFAKHVMPEFRGESGKGFRSRAAGPAVGSR